MAVTQTFNPSAVVNTTTNTFNITAHGFVADKGVIYTTGGGTAIGGLVDGYKYYIIWIDADNFRLASTEDNARAGTAVDLLSTGSGAFHNITSSVIFPNSAAYHDFFRRIRLLGTGLPIEGRVIEAESVRDSLTIIGGNNITLTDIDDIHNVFTINAPDYNLTVPVTTTNIRLENSLGYQDVTLTPVRGISITRLGAQEIGFESFGVTETDTLQTVASRGNITNHDIVVNNILVGKVVSTPGEDGVSGVSISHVAGGLLTTTGNGTLDYPLLLSPDESQSTDASDTITIAFTTPSAGSLSYTAVYKCSAVLTSGSVVLERKDPSTLLWVPLDSSTGTTERTSYQISNQYGEGNTTTTDYRIRFSWSGNFEYVNYRIRVTFEAAFLPGKEIISTDTDNDSFIIGDDIGTGLIRGTNTFTGHNTFTDVIETNGLKIFQNNIEGTNSNDNIVIDPHGTGALELRSQTLTTDQTTFNLINTTATTVNAFGEATTANVATAGTTVNIGANSGTLTIGNPTVVGTQSTQNLYNTVATTVNAFGAATTIDIGAAGGAGTVTIKNDNVVLNGDLQVKGGDITTDQTSFNIINGTATTIQAFGAAETLVFASATGTTTFRSDVVINNDLQVKGGDLTTNATTFNLLNTTATTINAFGAASTANIATAGTTISIGASSGTTTVNNSLTVTGDFIVNGNTTTLNVSTLDVEDLNITMAKGAPNAAAADGAGLTVDGASATLTYTSADDSWNFNKILKATSLEGTPVGTTTRAAGSFTTLDANGDVTFGDAVADNITVNGKFVAGTIFRSSQTAADTLNIAAYDTDNTLYRNLITLTAGASPTLTIVSNGTGTIDNINIGDTTRGTGKFTTLDASQTVTLSPDSYNITISPTNTGTVTVNPATAGTINNMSIGVTTAAAGRFTTLKVKDTSAAFDLSVIPTSSTALTADRSLTVDVINASRTVKLAGNIDLGGNLTTASSFTTSGNFALTLTTTNTTSVTLPTTGTLATLAGSESLTNKKLGSLTSNGIVTTSGGDGTLSVTATTGSGNVVLASGASLTAVAGFALRDTSAAFDVTLTATSSTTLTAGRTLTLDIVDAARSVKLAGNIDIAGNLTTANSFTTSGNFALTLTTTASTNVTLPTTGTLATLAGSESLTNKKLGSLTSNGIVTTSGGDGTLSVTGTTGTGSVVLGSNPSLTSPSFGSSSTTFDGDATIDASATTFYAYSQSASGTARTISVSNLTTGRMVWIYLRNTNAASKTITIQCSSTTSGYVGVYWATGAGAAQGNATTITLAATTGTAMVFVANINGGFFGGSM